MVSADCEPPLRRIQLRLSELQQRRQFAGPGSRRFMVTRPNSARRPAPGARWPCAPRWPGRYPAAATVYAPTSSSMCSRSICSTVTSPRAYADAATGSRVRAVWPRKVALVQGSERDDHTVVAADDQPHPPVDDEGHALGHLAGELDALVGAVAGDAGVGEQLLLVRLAQPQRRRDDAQWTFSTPLWRGEFVLGLVQVQPDAPRRIPDPAQEHRSARPSRRRASATGSTSCTESPPAGELDGAASGRKCGSAPATRINIAHTSSGGSSTENTVVTVMVCAPGGRLRVR